MATMKKSVILDLDLTLKEKALSPYWTEQLKERSSILWFPTKTDLQKADLNLSNGLLQEVEGASHVLTSLLINKKPITTNLSQQSLLSVIPTMEKEQIITKKIRIYPKNESKFIELCDLSRYVYNQKIEYHKNYWLYSKNNDFRKIITDYVKHWNNYVNHVMGEACRKADITAKSIISKRKKGIVCDYSFKSKKDSVQGFDIHRLGDNIYPKFLGKETYVTEKIPKYAKGKAARVIVENNEWYLCCCDLIKTKKQTVNTNSTVVSLDPGIRTFLTGFSTDKVFDLGRDFFKNKILPNLLKLDKYISSISKLRNLKEEDKLKQWYSDRIIFLNKKIKKLKARTKHLVKDLHNKSIQFLIKNYAIILLPTFEVSNMVCKSNRNINNKSVRAMLSLSHFQFKERLKWACEKNGKTLILCNEAYTSKTNPFTGELMNIGSAREFSYNGEIYDRDINGARNILIKNLL